MQLVSTLSCHRNVVFFCIKLCLEFGSNLRDKTRIHFGVLFVTLCDYYLSIKNMRTLLFAAVEE